MTASGYGKLLPCVRYALDAGAAYRHDFLTAGLCRESFGSHEESVTSERGGSAGGLAKNRLGK
jgi:hypothetical protein